jgi:hypothetical protein
MPLDMPTRLDLYALGRDHLVQRAKRIDPTQVDVLGSDANIFVGSVSVMLKRVVDQLGYEVAKKTLDGCEDQDLDRWLYDEYKMLRKGASSAVGTVRFYRATSGTSGVIPKDTQIRTLSGAVYITTSAASFGTTDLTSIADVRAAEAGKATQAGANTIRSIVTPGALFDPTIQVNNDEAAAGGEDAEGNDDFRERGRDFWPSARRGTLGAIEFGAREVPGVVSAQAVEVTETLNLNGVILTLPARVVILYISDSSGVASAALAKKVETQLLEYRAGGIAVIVMTSKPQLVSILLKLAFRANVDTVALAGNVQSSVVEYINSLPVNAKLTVADILVVLSRYKEDGLIIDQNSVVAPVGDIIPTPGQTIRTTTDLVVIQ